MPSFPSLSAFALALAAAFSAPSVHASVTLIQSFEEIGGKRPATTNTIHLDKDRVRIDAGMSPDTYFIYRGDKKAFYTVNLKEKTYMEMTEKDLAEIAAKMDDAMKKMKETLAKLPPEQRKTMEEMMHKMMPGGIDAPKTVYKKVGAAAPVNGWSAQEYEGLQNGEKHSEIWTTAPKNLQIDDADFQVIKDMGRFFEKFSKNMDWLAQANTKNGFEGMPIKTVSYKDGQPHFKTEMKEVKKEAQPASLFEIPAGLTLKEMSAKP